MKYNIIYRHESKLTLRTIFKYNVRRLIFQSFFHLSCLDASRATLFRRRLFRRKFDHHDYLFITKNVRRSFQALSRITGVQSWCRAAFNAPISISQDKNAPLNERTDLPLHWFYIRCIRCLALSLEFAFQYLSFGESAPLLRDIPCIDIPTQENVASSRKKHIFWRAR